MQGRGSSRTALGTTGLQNFDNGFYKCFCEFTFVFVRYFLYPPLDVIQAQHPYPIKCNLVVIGAIQNAELHTSNNRSENVFLYYLNNVGLCVKLLILIYTRLI